MADGKWIDFSGLDSVMGIDPKGKIWMENVDRVHSQEGEMNAFYGKNHTEETKEQMKGSAKRRDATGFKKKQSIVNAKKTWTFISPEYKVVRIRGSLNQFCKERGLNTGAMASIHKAYKQPGHGQSKQHKGWRVLNG